MPIDSTTQRENLAVEYGARAAVASLHTADPGLNGANEVTGGVPAYARAIPTWAPGTVDGTVTATVTFDVPGGVTVNFVGLWDVDEVVFLDATPITSQTFASQGTYQVNLTYTQS